MKMNIFMCALAASVTCLAVGASYAQSSNIEAVSRQVMSLKNTLDSFRANIDGRLDVLEVQFEDCSDGSEYGTVEYGACTDQNEVGFTLSQCMNGSWRETVDTCAVPRQQYARVGDGRVNPRLPNAISLDAEAGLLVGGGPRFMSGDTTTLDQFCRDKGFLGIETYGRHVFSSCGNDAVVGYDGSDYVYGAAATFGCSAATHVICTNNSLDVIAP